MGKLWKVKSARIKGENLVIVAEKEIPLAKILDNEVLEGEPEEERLLEPSEPVEDEDEEVSDEEAKKRLGIKAEEEEEEEKASPEEVMERAGKVQNGIEEVQMQMPGKPVSKLKGQKGRILASIDNGNETLAEISKDTTIGQSSVSGQLTWLTKNGFAKRAGRGQYGITAKGKNYLKKLEEIE